MGSTETVESLVQKLAASSDAEELTELVLTLKTVLGHYSRADLADKIVSNENLLEILFGCLSPNPEHEQLVQNSCDILKQLMAIADPSEILSRYSKDMLEGLEEHPLPDVRQLVLAQMDKCLESDTVVQSLTSTHSNLILAVIRQHTFPELSVANKASIFIVKLASNHFGAEYLAGDESLSQFLDLVSSTCNRSVERYRVYDTLAKLATVSPELFERIQTSLNLAPTLSDLVFGNSDPLGGANALEILATLAGTPFGLEAVKQIGVVERIERMTQELEMNPLSSLLFPEILKFIGKVGVNQLPPQRLREIVLESVMRRDMEMYVTTVAVEALTLMGCTKEGKQYLFGKEQTIDCFKRASDIVQNAQTEYRVRILDAMTILFGTDDVIGSGHQYCLPHWFNLLFPQISTLFELVQQPFPDIRLSSLNFLTVVAPLEWAQRHYLSTPGIVEFLTNRDAEPNKECLIAKYKIVSIIADSKSAAKILKAEDYGRLKIYKDQGPFYSPATSAVATEGSS